MTTKRKETTLKTCSNFRRPMVSVVGHPKINHARAQITATTEGKITTTTIEISKSEREDPLLHSYHLPWVPNRVTRTVCLRGKIFWEEQRRLQQPVGVEKILGTERTTIEGPFHHQGAEIIGKKEGGPRGRREIQTQWSRRPRRHRVMMAKTTICCRRLRISFLRISPHPFGNPQRSRILCETTYSRLHHPHWRVYCPLVTSFIGRAAKTRPLTKTTTSKKETTKNYPFRRNNPTI